MKPTFHMIFDSQESAESAYETERMRRILLLDRLEQLNEKVDSLSLATLIREARS